MKEEISLIEFREKISQVVSILQNMDGLYLCRIEERYRSNWKLLEYGLMHNESISGSLLIFSEDAGKLTVSALYPVNPYLNRKPLVIGLSFVKSPEKIAKDISNRIFSTFLLELADVTIDIHKYQVARDLLLSHIDELVKMTGAVYDSSNPEISHIYSEIAEIKVEGYGNIVNGYTDDTYIVKTNSLSLDQTKKVLKFLSTI